MRAKDFLAAILLVLGMGLLAGCVGSTQSGTVIVSKVINAPPEKISSFMCGMSEAEMKEVFPAIKEINNKQGKPCTVGYSEDETQCIAGQCRTMHLVWVDIVPNQRYQLKYAGDAYGTTTYLFSPEANGTRMTIILEVSGKLPMGLSYDMIKSEFEKSGNDSLAAIKAKVEK